MPTIIMIRVMMIFSDNVTGTCQVKNEPGLTRNHGQLTASPLGPSRLSFVPQGDWKVALGVACQGLRLPVPAGFTRLTFSLNQ